MPSVYSVRSRAFFVAVLFLWLCSGESTAWAQSEDALWTQATNQMAAGDDAGAAALLDTLVTTYPDSPLADDALFLRAQLLGEKLGDPASARRAYQTLVETYPDSRSALAASRRLLDLSRALGSNDLGAAPLAKFQALLSGFPQRSIEQSIAMAETILHQYPDWQSAHKVKLWLASAARKQGHLDSALTYYHDIQSSQAPRSAIVSAIFESSEVYILQGQYQKAEDAISTLKSRQDLSPSERQSVAELRRRLEKTRKRALLLTLSYWGFLLMNIFLLALLRRQSKHWADFTKRLRSPPIEFLYTLPVVVLLFAMALTGHEEIAPAVGIISGGSLIITWLVGATLSSMTPLTLPWAGLCAALATAATACLCYYALYRSQLLDLIATTVQFGPG